MATIDHFNLRSFDLNLLVAFDALMSEGSVTRAAQRLKIRQPAMSHALSTLRALLQDELFIRVGQAMQPTARARSLAVPVRHALRQAQIALTGELEFDPKTEERTFRIAMLPELELVMVPGLTARLRQLAPGIRILASGGKYETMETMLDNGGLDLLLGCSYEKSSRRSFEPLYQPQFACCFNPRLLDLPNPIGLEAYLTTEHATVSHTDTLEGCIKDALDILGIELNVVSAAPNYMTVLEAAQISPLIATVPKRIADRYCAMLGLTVSPLPVSFTCPPVDMVWAKHADADPANCWLREQVRLCLAATCQLQPAGTGAASAQKPLVGEHAEAGV